MLTATQRGTAGELAYRGAGRGGKGIELQFMASPNRADKWSTFRGDRLEPGPRLINPVESAAGKFASNRLSYRTFVRTMIKCFNSTSHSHLKVSRTPSG